MRGKYGGYQLTKEPKEYTVYDILAATEDSIAVVACLEEEVNTCPMSQGCRTLPLWEHLQNHLREYMQSFSPIIFRFNFFHSQITVITRYCVYVNPSSDNSGWHARNTSLAAAYRGNATSFSIDSVSFSFFILDFP